MIEETVPKNLEWERRRREAEEISAQRMHARDVDERRARMVLRQQQKDADSRKRRKEGAAKDKDKENRGPPEDSGLGLGEVKADDPAAVIKVCNLI